MIDVDVVVVGAGFSGALMALGLRAQGQRVALVERGRHPRFAIGESSTPLANLLLEEIADRYNLPRVRTFSKWGTWQQSHPDVGCGLKRGFTFLFHTPGEPFVDTAAHTRQLMVAASPHDEIADTHWYRPDFDHALAREAEAAGVIYLDETRIDTVRLDERVSVLDGVRHGRAVRIGARFVVDASGPRGFLHRALSLEEARLRHLPPTEGLFTHFEGVERWDRLNPSAGEPPYPADDAALHHVFPGGWIWILRFNNGITSAGAALTRKRAETLGWHDAALGRRSPGEGGWERLLASLPSVQAQFRQARPTLPFMHVPRLAYRSAVAGGSGWALLPSAAGVVDPLLSTGFPLTLLGVKRLLDVLGRTSPGGERDAAVADYARTTLRELEVTELLVAALYAAMDDPPLFKRLSLLYFAAASFSETARRLGRPALAPGFLLEAHPRFGPELRACARGALDPTRLHSSSFDGSARSASPSPEHARTERDRLFARISSLIEPFDTAGFLDTTRHDWFPVTADDLIANASKLDATVEEVYALLARCGFTITDARRSSHHSSSSSVGGPTMKSA